MRNLVLWIILTYLIKDVCSYIGVYEYCLSDTFKASCPDKEIILMTHAMYGRMQIGKCVTSDLGLGCSMNAIKFLDKTCSGKKTCEYYAAEKELVDANPCSKDFRPYLEASYQCIPVASAFQQYPCAQNSFITLDSSYGYISSTLAHERGWGTVNCPWMLQALPGQTFNLTLISFQSKTTGTSCKAIGFATDVSINQNVTICQSSKRKHQLLQSVGHSVHIQLATSAGFKRNFVIQYEVVGCADLVAPDHAWHRRIGDVATIGCEHGNKTWHLKCVGNVWHGVVGNCSSFGMSLMIIIIGVVSATLLVAICIILLALRPACCSNRQQKQESYPHFDTNSISTGYGYASNKAHTRSSWACTFKSGANMSDHIWETPLPEPTAPPATEHMLAATMRHPNPMETSITSSGGDYTWPTRFISPSNIQQDLHSADYTHPSMDTLQTTTRDPNDDYTVPVNVTESLLQVAKDRVKKESNNQDDYMAPSDIQQNYNENSASEIHYPHLPTETFKRQLDKILHDSQIPMLIVEDDKMSETNQGEAFSTEAVVEYAIPNNTRLSQVPKDRLPSDEDEEYTLPTNMRPPGHNEKNIPSAEQI